EGQGCLRDVGSQSEWCLAHVQYLLLGRLPIVLAQQAVVIHHAPGHRRIVGALQFQMVEAAIGQPDDQVRTAQPHAGVLDREHLTRLSADEQAQKLLGWGLKQGFERRIVAHVWVPLTAQWARRRRASARRASDGSLGKSIPESTLLAVGRPTLLHLWPVHVPFYTDIEDAEFVRQAARCAERRRRGDGCAPGS